MADESKPTQKTPEGKEIPVPKRKDFFGALKRVAKDQATKRTSTKR